MRLPLFPTLLTLLSTIPRLTLTSSGPLTTLTPWEQIHQTLHLYPLAIDLKNQPLFADVFAPHAFANYTSQLSNLTGLATISAALIASVANLTSQHALSTTYITISDATHANSSTYFTANLFGVGAQLDKVVYLYGYYADELSRLEGLGWRIVRRQLVFLGPILGDLALIGL